MPAGRSHREPLLPRHASLLRDKSQVFDNSRNQRDARLAAFDFGETFGVAGDQRTGGARSRFGRSESANPVVDLPLELGGIDEGLDPHGTEEVADPLADSARRLGVVERERRSTRAPIGTAQGAAQQIDHRAQAITFVAAVIAIGNMPTYGRYRAIPCESMPRRSLSTRMSAACSASCGGMPKC